MTNATQPTTLTLSITSSLGTASTCCDVPGALDYDVTVTDENGNTVTGEVTLVPDVINGGLCGYGPSVDYWMTADMIALVCALGESCGRELCSAIIAECESDDSTPNEIEIDLHIALVDARLGGQADVEEILREEGGIETLRKSLRNPACVEWGESAGQAAHASKVSSVLWDAWRAAYEIAAEAAATEAVEEYDSEVADAIDDDGDCVDCGHPANGSSGHGSCSSLAHGGA